MAVVKNLMVRAGADFSELKKETEKAQKTLADFKKNTSNILKGLGLATGGLAIANYLKDSVKSAMQVESSMQQIDRIMGKNSDDFKKWADTQANAFNMSKAEAMKYGAVYGNLISGFTKNTSQTTKYTEQLIKSSAIVAIGTGRTMEDTMDRIRSGLLGNTEAIEDLGINVNVAMIESTKAFAKFADGKKWNHLSYQTQQQIRLMAILEQASAKYGDSINNNTSAQLQKLSAIMQDVKLNLGQAFKPLVDSVIPLLIQFAEVLKYITEKLKQFMELLFGKQIETQSKQTDDLTKSEKKLGNQLKDTGKQAKGAVLAFDEVNTLQEQMAGSADVLQDTLSDTGGLGNASDELDNLKKKLDRPLYIPIKISYGGDWMLPPPNAIQVENVITTVENRIRELKAMNPVGVAIAVSLSGAETLINLSTAVMITKKEIEAKFNTMTQNILNSWRNMKKNLIAETGPDFANQWLTSWLKALRPIENAFVTMINNMLAQWRALQITISNGAYKAPTTTATSALPKTSPATSPTTSTSAAKPPVPVPVGTPPKPSEDVLIEMNKQSDAALGKVLQGAAAVGVGAAAVSGVAESAAAAGGAAKLLEILKGIFQSGAVPAFATGGIVSSPMLAMVGDNATQDEAIAPIGDLQDMIATAVGNTMLSVMQMSKSSSSNSGDIIINIDGTQFARVVSPYLEKEKSRVGTKLIMA